MKGIKIRGVGSFLPDNVVTNEQYAQFLDTSDEWIRTRTGISTRRIADSDTAWSMGKNAAQRALEDAGMQPEEIDLIIVSTLSPDYMTPSMSSVIQGVIGAKNAICLDINCACSGFVYGLDMAARYLHGGDDIKSVLLVCTEMVSSILDFTDRASCVLFGDGAGSCVIQAADALFVRELGADGTGAHLIFCKNRPRITPFNPHPPTPNEISLHPAQAGHFVQDGKEVYKFATRMMPQAVERACQRAGISTQELDWIVPHQANARILQTAMKNLNLPFERAWVNISHTGNTSSASIPIALDELAHSGKLLRGQKVCTVGFGAGLQFGAAVFEW